MKNKDILKQLALEFCLTCPHCDRKMPNINFRKKKDANGA